MNPFLPPVSPLSGLPDYSTSEQIATSDTVRAARQIYPLVKELPAFLSPQFMAYSGLFRAATGSGSLDKAAINSLKFALSLVPIFGNAIDISEGVYGLVTGRNCFNNDSMSQGEACLSIIAGGIGLAFDMTGFGAFVRGGGEAGLKGAMQYAAEGLTKTWTFGSHIKPKLALAPAGRRAPVIAENEEPFELPNVMFNKRFELPADGVHFLRREVNPSIFERLFNRKKSEVLSTEQLVNMRKQLRQGDKKLVVDIGSGNGATLSNLGKEFQGQKVVGVDMSNAHTLMKESSAGFPHLSTLPRNVEYHMLAVDKTLYPYVKTFSGQYGENEWSRDVFNKAVLNNLGAGSASQVFVHYPWPIKADSAKDKMAKLFFSLKGQPVTCRVKGWVDLSDQLLAKGGRGVVVTEDLPTIELARKYLEEKGRALSYSHIPLTERMLREVGVVPFTNADGKTFNQAYMLIFEK